MEGTGYWQLAKTTVSSWINKNTCLMFLTANAL